VSGYGWGTITQVQTSGVDINKHSFPPQSAFFFSLHHSGSEETVNLRYRNNVSESSSEKEFLNDSDASKYLLFEGQESYKSVCVFIKPGLGVRELIFPFHFHTYFISVNNTLQMHVTKVRHVITLN